MGQEIVYCFKCLTRVTSAEIEKGKAKRFENRVACASCAPGLLATLAPAQREAAQPSSKKKSGSTRVPIVAPTPRPFRPAAPKPSGTGFWIGIAAGGVLLLVILAVALSGGPPPKQPLAPPSPVKDVAQTPPPPKDDSRLREAQEAFERAVKLQVARPGDFDVLIPAFEEALRKADRTPLFRDVVRAYDAVVARLKDSQPRIEAATPGWRAVFDGRTTDSLLSATASAWKVENGALLPAVEKILPLKTKEEFGDVDLRIRLEFVEASNLCLWGRQSHEGMLGVEWDRSRLDALRGAPHEFILSLRGERATLKLDGVEEAAVSQGRVMKAPLQISLVGRGFRILAIEVREAPAPPVGSWRSICDGRSLDWMSGPSREFWRVENGGLVPNPAKPGPRDTIQSRETFGDGELRFVFEVTGPLDSVHLAARQGAAGRVTVKLDGLLLRDLPYGRHEVLLTCRGAQFSATLDGSPAPIVQEGGLEAVGHVQISVQGNGLKILTLDWR